MMVTVDVADVELTLPAASVAVAVKVWAPSASAELRVTEKLPADAVAVAMVVLESLMVTSAPDSAVPAMFKRPDCAHELSDGAEIVGVLGAVVSITTDLLPEIEPAAPGDARVRMPVLPATSLMVPLLNDNEDVET